MTLQTVGFMPELLVSGPGQDSVDCAFCYANLDFMSVPQREIHYENHFSSMMVDAPDTSNPPQPPSSAKAIVSSQSKGKKIWPLLKETDDFWYPAHTTTPPPSFTPGMVSRSIQHSSYFNIAKG
jgi:hypothetical protein